MFSELTAEQVNTTHNLYKFLRRLRIIGIVETATKQVKITEIGRPIRYRLKFVSYDPFYKNNLTPAEKFEKHFQSSI